MAQSPLPSANPEEHQYWTDPILCEETRTRLEYYRSIGWLPPNHKPKTLEGIAVVERYWRKYCLQLEKDYVDYLLSEDQAIYMNFFDWMHKTSRKKLLQSYDEYWRRLKQYFSLFARRRMDQGVQEQMRRFINGRFPAEHSISRRMKEKSTLSVDVFCILYRHHWIHSKFFRHGSMLIQFATIQLWSSITGTRPGVLLPQKAYLPNNTSLGKRKQGLDFQSDIPQYVSAKDLPDSVCYRDIDLFYLKDSNGNRDVLCAIIEFRNLKGRPEGADGTRFFMHCDYQLAYCPILQIITYAFRDKAFANTMLTPEIIWRLQVPDNAASLPLQWKPEVLDTPLLRHVQHTEYGLKLDKSRPMAYATSREAMRELGRDAKFKDDVGHYNYRRWTANEANRHFTSQERQRVLGQSGDGVFERHYQSQFVQRDLQNVVLLRPPQEHLLQAAGSMLRKRDLSAPSSELTEEQRRTICQDPRIVELKRAKREVMEEMRSLAGTKKNARQTFPHLYQRHESLCKELSQLRKTLAKDTKETARKDHFYNAPILEVNRQIKRLLGQADPEDSDDFDEKDWEPPTPRYIFPERERLVEIFYGPDAENYEEDNLLARRIQATKDMVALSTLCEPSRRGNRVNWNFDDDESAEHEKPCCLEEKTPDCPTDVCIICYGLSRRSTSNPPPHRFPPKRLDSLRRHLIDCHLAKAYDGISCTWKMCNDVPKFTKITDFLVHAIEVHTYDINIQQKHLPPWQLVSGREDSSFDDSDPSSGSDRHSGIETPASSISSDMANIDPRLIESGPIHSTKCSIRRSKRLKASM
ncbi:conserved hypothetical protein [Talaromyces stipitatus ATCC 10500]|uniref:FluG domain-containing protein n=1 Tax=Talaromyces stipitatus (strain ATCC 10500 / CBS 375.48 / QM 6759 / NRRL 1006) TaxID=441959 RepID=B8MFU1_TALSN|nr:uncharacterized protein TSTA_009300 [Talaromyces stipitatus ATCC 10500]EED15808.1 conserved hypothetical protein [Talaromyces stipitatus ATCC 10500]